ncbi:DUF4286 family protein [Pontibacter arcticus]|uniref:DUF4286 domain-containing protein n=1 Tax=Pontibacter arcticus TaxID=2080288 RepID=A0A364RJA5_9BACT|nr:DUF4286 family protein [Pontibacter arcticus]RAU84387.1 DUF4286 domain-containing protein [Pontibacter arcticus]
MIIYNVTVNIDNSVADEWLQWMQEVHIPDVMKTGFFLHNQISRMIDEIDNGGVTYAVQYKCRNLEDLEEYQNEHADAIQSRHDARYANQYVTFSSTLEIVASDVERTEQAG